MALLRLFLCLGLPSLCLSAQCAADACYSSDELHKRFLEEHTEFHVMLKCDDLMNRILLERDSGNCKRCHTVITADRYLKTLASDLRGVCRGGSWIRDNVFQSRRSFHMITCWNINPTASPPNCRYIPQSALEPITLTCQDGNPVYFDSCYSNGRNVWER